MQRNTLDGDATFTIDSYGPCCTPVTTTTTTTVITDYYYYELQSCTTSETANGYSIYSSLSGVVVAGPADCYSIVSQVGSGTLPSGVDLDVLVNVTSCFDPSCVS